ncbi:MAG: GNAT family N-acetyltransferase [Gammaproteobacteria bacterium]|nr:GNAT family N-acetyltransferase [Gammaproteobacteria bacterium]
MPESKDQYYIRDYHLGDETAITALFNIVFGQTLTEAQWRWKYTGMDLAPPIARLAFKADGQLVGHAGAITLHGWRQGQSLPFFQICDVMVHPAARGHLGGRNLFARLFKELGDRLAGRWPDAFGYGFPGRRPFRLGEYIRAYGRVEQALAMHRTARSKRLSPIYTRPLTWDDPRLDRLWARLAPGFGLALIRDRAFLTWRYATNPFHTYDLLGFQVAGWLLGWAVVRWAEDRLRVIDLLVPRRCLEPALRALDHLAAVGGVDDVEIWLPSSWRAAISGRLEPTEVVVGNMIWRLPIPTTEVRETLYYTMGDLDIF